jgi:hypothetical protein
MMVMLAVDGWLPELRYSHPEQLDQTGRRFGSTRIQTSNWQKWFLIQKV